MSDAHAPDADVEAEVGHFVVVVNNEGQYSIWPKQRPLPPGWRADGYQGDKASCLAHIDRVWTDMRPLSLRRHLGE